jgi:1-acyl-sn-glycerol-3-phosphate acyltransferase
MGAQSSFFGPVKYSILPQLLHKDELVGGNALVETGTFLAILFGTILGGVLVSVPDVGVHLVGGALVVVAVAGFLTSLRVPDLPPENPGLRISLNPVTPLVETARVTRANRAVFLSILGISWFWFYGSCFLALLPDYGKSVLHGGEHVVTLLLALFCVGTAIGSLLCDRLSGHKIELGLVPIGSIGMTLAGFDLFLVGTPPATTAELLSATQFVGLPGSWRVMIDFVMIALFGGLFIVPLYTMVQQRSEAEHRSRVIAGSNILGAFFMVASSLMLMALLRVGLSLPQIFAVLALMNVAVAVYIYQVIPEFLLRFVAWVVANVMYRMRVIGLENIPEEGPALLVCNHVSLVDWLIVASACDRPPRFVMYHGFAKSRFAGWFFRDAKVIPIAPAHESRETMNGAFDRIAAELEDGNLVCIFPEGKLTKDGELNPFRTGVERIVARTPVPVIPMALKGMWGSYFSRKDGAALKRPFRRVWSRISLVIGPAVAPEEADALALSRRVARLADMTPPPTADLGPAVVNN